MGFKGHFALEHINYNLNSEFINLGFKTIVVCVNERYLDKSFVGRVIDRSFIDDLPDNVDVCGENGEFHTFTFDGPLFSNLLRKKLFIANMKKPTNSSTSL
jgi:diphthamide synthase (EF-2-diphthine--ammonia ligase)